MSNFDQFLECVNLLLSIHILQFLQYFTLVTQRDDVQQNNGHGDPEINFRNSYFENVSLFSVCYFVHLYRHQNNHERIRLFWKLRALLNRADILFHNFLFYTHHARTPKHHTPYLHTPHTHLHTHPTHTLHTPTHTLHNQPKHTNNSFKARQEG